MKKISYYLSFLIIFNACSNGTKDVIEEKNVIHLAEAMANPVKMNLSEIVDSVKFVPISSKEYFIRGPQLLTYSKPYLMAYPGVIYNMQGECVGSVGSVGENTDMCTLRGKNDSTLLFCFTNFHKKNSLAATSSHVCLFLIRTTFSTLMKTRSRVKVANTAAPFPRTSGPSWPHPPLHLQSCPRALIRVRIQG